MSKLLLGLFCLCLVACSTPQPNVVIGPSEKQVHIDPKLLERCKDKLEPLVPTGPNSTVVDADFFTNAAKNAKIHEDCVNRQDASIQQLKQFANIKDVHE